MNRYTQPAVLRTVLGVVWRLCAGCDHWHPFDAEHFHRSRGNRAGLTPRCKSCNCAASVLARHARKLGQIAPWHAHADDGLYWVRYRRRNAQRARKAP